MNRILARGFAMLMGGLLLASAAPASATTLPGTVLKAAFAGDNGCINIRSYGGIGNDCTYPVLLVGTVPASENAWHPTNVSIFGDNSSCQTVTINGVGNGAQVGNVVFTTAGPQTWQTLDLGSRFVWPSSGIVFRCNLEPKGEIGLFTAQ
jgi:hypothetical protein